MPSPEEEKILSDFRVKDCPAFVQFTGKQTKGPKVLAWTDADIPLTKDGFGDKKQIGVNITIVDILSDGFSKVPYELVDGKYKCDAKKAKPLSEKSAWPEDPENFHMLTCFPYEIVEDPKEKEARKEDFKWNVYPGMILRTSFWPDSAR